jgi:hypothetical protein
VDSGCAIMDNTSRIFISLIGPLVRYERVFTTLYMFTEWLPSVQQIHLRASQSVFLSKRYPEIFERGSVSLPKYAIKYVKLRDICLEEEYILLINRSFYNLIWLILNDVIFGHVLGAFLFENNEALTSIMTEMIEVCSIQIMIFV